VGRGHRDAELDGSPLPRHCPRLRVGHRRPRPHPARGGARTHDKSSRQRLGPAGTQARDAWGAAPVRVGRQSDAWHTYRDGYVAGSRYPSRRRRLLRTPNPHIIGAELRWRYQPIRASWPTDGIGNRSRPSHRLCVDRLSFVTARDSTAG
jgi:hypothetical protein